MIFPSWHDIEPFSRDILKLDKNSFPGAFWQEAIWEGLFNHNDVTLELLFQRSIPIAYIIFSQISDEAELLRLGVSPIQRRKGIGRQLIKRMMMTLRSNHSRKLFLETRIDNRAAVYLYQSCGFKKAGKRKGYYSSPPADALIYTICL